MKTLIRGADVVFPDQTRAANVMVQDGKIASIDADADATADEVIDATGLHLMPGVIDDQVHFRDPGLTHKEDLYTGSKACAKGGVTSFLEMPNTNPTTTSVDALHAKLDLAASKCLVNFGFYIGATPDNVDELKNATRTPGIKIFIGSSTGNLLVDQQAALERIFGESILPICAHCEDEATVKANAAKLNGGSSYADHSRIRNHEAALIATKRAVDLADRHNHRFHVLHVSTGDEVDFLRTCSDLISAEACPHHLLFNVILAVVALHITAALFYLIFKRQNLIGPMITGTKWWPTPLPKIRMTPAWVAIPALAVGAGAVWAVVTYV